MLTHNGNQALLLVMNVTKYEIQKKKNKEIKVGKNIKGTLMQI